jgi:hypothetical protein
MTREEVPPPSDDGISLIPVSSVENWDEMLDYFANMTEDECKEYIQAILDTMTFEEQAEFLRRFDGMEDE